jgi:hypothetical protein
MQGGERHSRLRPTLAGALAVIATTGAVLVGAVLMLSLLSWFGSGRSLFDEHARPVAVLALFATLAAAMLVSLEQSPGQRR